MLTFSIHTDTPLLVCSTYSKPTLRRTTGCNTDYWDFYHQAKARRRVHRCQRRSFFVPTTKTLPDMYTTDMVYPVRKTTITHVYGKEIPPRQTEDDLLQPGAANNDPSGRTRTVAWTWYTHFIVRATQFDQQFDLKEQIYNVRLQDAIQHQHHRQSYSRRQR